MASFNKMVIRWLQFISYSQDEAFGKYIDKRNIAYVENIYIFDLCDYL